MLIDQIFKITLVADNEMLRCSGLMWKKPLRIDECAFFTFDSDGDHKFWNKNVSFPISVIFCDKDKNIVHIGHLDAHQIDGISSGTKNVKYVVETHESAPSAYKILIGNRIDLKGNILKVSNPRMNSWGD